MNQLQAFRDTLEFARKIGLENLTSDEPNLDYQHLASMLAKAETWVGENDIDTQSKLGRYLGWAQAAVISRSNGLAKLSDMIEINKRNI